MSEIKNTPGTPAITKEAREFDTVRTLPEGIKLAAYLYDKAKEAEVIRVNPSQASPKETPIATPKDIKEEITASERPFIQDNER